MTLYCAVFVYVFGVAGAQFQGFEPPVFTGPRFGFKQVGPWKHAKGTATIEDKVQVELEETRGKVQQLQEMLEQQEKQASAVREQMQVELNDTRGTVQWLEDRLKQQEKQQLSTKGELLVHSKETRDEVQNLTDRFVQKEKQLMEIQEEMQEVNKKLKSTSGNLQNAVKESEEKLKVVRRNIKKQCLLMDQWQYSLGQAKSDGGNGKPAFLSATSSSTNIGGEAVRAIDGNTDAIFRRGSCSHTDPTDPSPWWQGRLSAKTEVHNITLTNRKDCCAFRLKNLKIEGFEEDPINNPEADPHLCKMHSDQVQGTETITCDSPIVARFIKISLHDKVPLTLCEVTLGGFILSTKGLAVQSSLTSFSTNANMATDDDVTTCFVTGSEAGDSPWWQMDLNGAFTVASVEITNRNDDKYDTEINTPKRCTSREEQVGQGEAVTLTCDVPQTGRYLRITKNFTIPGEVLSLCDVSVNVLPSQ